MLGMQMKLLLIKEENNVVSIGWVIAAYIIGGLTGVFVMALCNASRYDNKEN